jgi:probable selenium-dependent hydroxylase accessory protein YqeC
MVAAVGAGGKTTTLGRLAAEARARSWSVILTTTTHMGPRAGVGPVLIEASGPDDHRLREALAEAGAATLFGRRIREDKLQGVSSERVAALSGMADLVLVEADGARGRSLKLPGNHEPVLPPNADRVVVLVGLDAVGAALDERLVHRVELVRGALPGVERLGARDVAAVLSSPAGYLSRAGPSRLALFLNKAETPERWRDAEEIAEILAPAYGRIVAGSARSGAVRVLK